MRPGFWLTSFFWQPGPSGTLPAAMWRVVKFLFPARMVEKLDFLPLTNKQAFEKRALRFIALEDLPKSHGGKREDYPCPVTGATGMGMASN